MLEEFQGKKKPLFSTCFLHALARGLVVRDPEQMDWTISISIFKNIGITFILFNLVIILEEEKDSLYINYIFLVYLTVDRGDGNIRNTPICAKEQKSLTIII